MDYNFIMNYLSEPACLQKQAELLRQLKVGGKGTIEFF